MTSLRMLPAMLTLSLVLIACGADNDESAGELAFAADDTTEATAPQEVSTTSTLAAPAPVPEELVSTSGGAVATTTTTTTVVGPLLDTCDGGRYRIVVPDGWNHQNCDAFSPAPFAGPGELEREWINEVSAAFTTSETYAEALSRINTTMTVVESSPITIDGLSGERLTITYEYWRTGERDTVVVDAGDGVFFLAADMLADTNANQLFSTIEERYAHSVSALEAILSSIEIDEGAPATAATPVAGTTFSPIHCATGIFRFSEHPASVGTGSGFAVESVELVRQEGGNQFLPVKEDGEYQVPQWSGPQDISAVVTYRDSNGTYESVIGHSCDDVLGGSYDICWDASVAIVYPETLVSKADLGGDLDSGCAFFRTGPEDGHRDHSITLTQYVDLEQYEVREAVTEFGNWQIYQPFPQGGPTEIWDLLSPTEANEVVGRAVLIPSPDGSTWALVADWSAVDAVEDMANNIHFEAAS